jgi:RecB family exonuclease
MNVPAYQDAFDRLACDAIQRIAVTMLPSELESAAVETDLADGFASAEEQPVFGLLVHRLFQYLAYEDLASSREDLVRRARALLAPSELSIWEEEEATLVERAIDALETVCGDPRIRPLLRDARWFHEVPFSMVDGSVVLRGVIDSLVEHADGVTVVEIKTGRARPEHERQLDVYRAAAGMLFPGRAIDAVLVYAGHDG